MKRVFFNFLLALEGIRANKLRTFLTALGIIFGVGAVIAMLAIGSGAKASILDRMKLIGTNNIVITSITNAQSSGEEESSSQTEETGARQDEDKRPYSPGLRLSDLQAIGEALPNVDRLSPEVVIPTSVIRNGELVRANAVGVSNAFFELNQLELGRGNFFHDIHMENGRPVCIIGKGIQNRFFPKEDPIGKSLKCGRVWLKVIGVLAPRNASSENLKQLGIRDYNADVYVPVTSALLRFKDRAMVVKNDVARGRGGNDDEEIEENYHQIDRAVVRVEKSNQMRASAEMVATILRRRHQNMVDFQIEIPELLLEQEQQTQETFNMVLAVIAGISLLVGGIGIMNIMLASVMERIKEIGVRRSLGAKKQDIIYQFLFEAVFISLVGGLIGVVLGVLAARIIAFYADIPTIVSVWSILLSFGVAASVGLVFGLFPARKAARQDPIKALRTD